MNAQEYEKTENKPQFIQNYLENDKRLFDLFIIACCHQIPNLNPNIQNAIHQAELYADNLITEYQFQKAIQKLTLPASFHNYSIYYALIAVKNRNPLTINSSFSAAIYNLIPLIQHYSGNPHTNYTQINIKQQIIILQNMKGNWNPNYNTKDVTELSNTIYNQKRYELMPILADALQEAGCDDKSILEYCQIPNFYFRGCWVLDKATGKR